MGATGLMSGYTTVPYTIAYANELVSDPIGFVPYACRQRLSYLPSSRSGDWVKGPSARSWEPGILRARVRDLRGKPDERGAERMRKLNQRRQWQCMDKRLCQVCGDPATDPETGLIPWLLTATVFERTGAESGRTNAPPTCWGCIPRAMEECPMLGESFGLVTAVGVESAGVLADMYRPGLLPGTLMPTAHNVFVSWDDSTHHPHALATSQVVELRGLRSVP
ncbi:hypothetical protein [Nonomuraea sp. NEAU-A123]|uniref:hypothetical protein n=1 Tax=Nonomuraea sp. NEAU-A123 TaxID=2839649 RepID=UPI001BE3EE70|nr:hypothetical protein [Nonomuraea sp. NEAU-A123]MBT2232192.1 hypothetical protein [Nonomuraea sp. NEAU-A123]